ncbi:MAG: SET domain-containing protein-lysine N-methyltransferase [Mitsuaria chitosanitabida]|uniref:SET domain-containing protein n=1 Tax=Roseateles chitosanitabidus TaxID=65048 RepID=UPI001B17A379|nr:SET domain-containing protein-lysine N-methyltransferase [Roseateles chitosanitabidus]MBO9687389.1 SET domain-containing protein-lysine N-methyltransferase [Roseateles chitosanitabidus]
MTLAYDTRTQFVAVALKRSRIDGYGVFAAEAIPAGTRLGLLTGESITVAEARRRAQESRRLMLVELSPARAIDCSRSQDAMRFTNHSCRPNARIQVEDGEVSFFALEDLAPGAEITVDYGATHHEGRLACRCGAEGCRGAL